MCFIDPAARDIYNFPGLYWDRFACQETILNRPDTHTHTLKARRWLIPHVLRSCSALCVNTSQLMLFWSGSSASQHFLDYIFQGEFDILFLLIFPVSEQNRKPFMFPVTTEALPADSPDWIEHRCRKGRMQMNLLGHLTANGAGADVHPLISHTDSKKMPVVKC